MKTVILYGSPRENGYTSRLVSSFCSAMPEDTPIRSFSAYELHVDPCCSCGFCEENWGCTHSDMEEIIDALLECDLLIIASPVYHLSFPAPLKAIFDRTQQCFCAYRHGRSPFADKQRQAVVLLTAGAPSETGEIIRRQLKWLLPPLNALLSGMVVCANTDEEGITRDAIDRAIALAESVFGTAGADKDDEPE
ncbi:MAG: NAD(P)H-dependent oxidoreductase [Ruminococcaceae bacterium]|nr:NAD(P)H-dependent oxidoreductase [Oscillospiraceae bacterium]